MLGIETRLPAAVGAIEEAAASRGLEIERVADPAPPESSVSIHELARAYPRIFALDR